MPGNITNKNKARKKNEKVNLIKRNSGIYITNGGR